MHKRRLHQWMDESLLIYLIRYTTLEEKLLYILKYFQVIRQKGMKHKGMHCKKLNLSYTILFHYIKSLANPRFMNDRMVIFINAI